MSGPEIVAREVRTPIGVVTFVSHPEHTPPVRCYGPDGIEIDPEVVMHMPHDDHCHDLVAFDLSVFAEKKGKNK